MILHFSKVHFKICTQFIQKNAHDGKVYCVLVWIMHIYIYALSTIIRILTLYCLARHLCDAVPKFWFQFKKASSKKFLWASQLWVGRRKEPILGYISKNYEKKNSGSKVVTNIDLYHIVVVWNAVVSNSESMLILISILHINEEN